MEKSDLLPIRVLVLDALMALKEGHGALCDGDARTAQIKIEVAAANLAEARKLMPAQVPPPVV